MVATVIANLLALVADLFSLFLFLWGVGILITGKFSIWGNALRGKSARLVGLLMRVQLVVGFGIYALIFEAFELGRGPHSSIVTAMADAIPVLLAAVTAFFWALSYAKAHKPEEIQPSG